MSRSYCDGCGANFDKGHVCLCPPEKCKCYHNPGNQFNYSPYNNCKQHPICPFDHAEKTLGLWRFPKTIELGGIVKANGQVEFRVRCIGCGRNSSGIGNENFRLLTSNGVQYTWTRGRYARSDDHRCQVLGCGSSAIEWHHFAPRNTFTDADDWPILPLCRYHHQRWHQTMDGYRWNAKTVWPNPPVPQLNTAINQLKQEKETA